jgi:hypothetical protein
VRTGARVRRSDDDWVTPVEGMLDILPLEVTPEAGEGTLGTWRFRAGPGHRARITVSFIEERVSQANHGCAGRARCQPERFVPRGQAAKGKPRSEPDWGKPAVRDRREAYGNVARGVGLRPTAKAVDSPPNPNVHAPQLYPDCFIVLKTIRGIPGLALEYSGTCFIVLKTIRHVPGFPHRAFRGSNSARLLTASPGTRSS